MKTLEIPGSVVDPVGSWVRYERGRRRLPVVNAALAELWDTSVDVRASKKNFVGLTDVNPVQCLYLTEDVGDRWRTGSCWVLMKGDRKEEWPLSVETLHVTRFAEFDFDGRVVFVQTQRRDDDLLNFVKVEEVDGWRNRQTFGTLSARTGIVKSLVRRTMYKDCPDCAMRKRVCRCASGLTSQYFERQFICRRRRHRQLPGRDLKSRILYAREWMEGMWTDRVKNGYELSYTTAPVVTAPDAFLRSTLARVLQSDIEQLLKPTAGLLSIEDHRKPALFPKRSENKGELIATVKVPDAEKKPTYYCPICNASIKRKYDVQRHIRSVHERRRDFQCTRCPQAFFRSSHLKDHMRGAHPDTSENMCPRCGKHFGMSSKLKRHMAAVHEHLRNFRCEHCQKAYKENSALKRHVVRHHSTLRQLSID